MEHDGFDEIASLRNAVVRLARRLRTHSDPGVTPSQMSALTTLERLGELRVGELARREDIGKSSVTRLVSRLESLGLVYRLPDPTDGRSYSVGLTEAGTGLLTHSSKLAGDFLARQVEALPREDRALLMAALPALERLATAKL